MTHGTDLSLLSDLLQAHVNAVNSGDVEALLGQCTEDVVYLGPGADPVVGKSQLEALLLPFYAANEATISMEARSRVVEGDLAYEWGSLTGTRRHQHRPVLEHRWK